MLTGIGAHTPAHHMQTHTHARSNARSNAPQIDCTAAEADPSRPCLVVEVRSRRHAKTSKLAGAVAPADDCPAGGSACVHDRDCQYPENACGAYYCDTNPMDRLRNPVW